MPGCARQAHSQYDGEPKQGQMQADDTIGARFWELVLSDPVAVTSVGTEPIGVG